MPLKVVQTFERGKFRLSCIPENWERGGELLWPRTRAEKLIKNEDSFPGEDWLSMQCTVKRSNMTYSEAQTELNIMSSRTDTDEDQTKTNKKNIKIIQDERFNDLANQCVLNQTNTSPKEMLKGDMAEQSMLRCNQDDNRCDENQGTSCMDYSKVTEDDNRCNENQRTSCMVTASENTTNLDNIVQIISTETLTFDQILVNQKILSEKIDNMLQIQAITLENQQKIVQKLATQSVQLKEISVQLAEMKEGPSVTLLKDANPVDNESFSLKPIENQRDLISLDQLLADRAEKNKLQSHLSFLCSASKGEGKTCAYKLQDILFTRDFLCNCSWAGGSRGDRSKIALKDYKNVLKFFHVMIQSWDPTYTVQDNETFFKIIPRNSKQRKSIKTLRMSSKRCRKNKDNLDKQQKSGNKRQPNYDKKVTEGGSIHNEEHVPNDESKETKGENMQIEEVATNDGYKKITEKKACNNMSDDDMK